MILMATFENIEKKHRTIRCLAGPCLIITIVPLVRESKQGRRKVYKQIRHCK